MNLLKGKNYQSDECIFDVHSFARELDEDTLRTKINGGGCDGSGPKGPETAQTSSDGNTRSGSGGAGSNTSNNSSATTSSTTTTSTGNTSTDNSPNPSNSGSGPTGPGYEAPPEVMSNPQAYAYWRAMQALAIEQGDPGRYKDYNVLPDYKQNIVEKNKNTTQKEQKGGCEIYFRLGYALTENIGGNSSGFKTDWLIDSKTNELHVLTQANFSQKQNANSFEYFGNVSLYVDGEKVENKQYEKLTSPYTICGSFDQTVGEVIFDLPSSYSSLSIDCDVDVIINYAYRQNYSSKMINIK